MKTTKEKIEIMKAYDRGEQIQINDYCDNVWKDIEFPGWNWINYDYRVKSKPEYVPFDKEEEFLEALRKHEKGMISINFGTLLKANEISITIDGRIYAHSINKYGEEIEYLGNFYYLYKNFKFADGTPCGKEVKE